MSARRGPAHIARNTVRAAGRRTSLIAGLIAVTVALAIVGTVVIRNSRSVALGTSAFDQRGGGTTATGGADIRVDWWGSGQPAPWFNVDRGSPTSKAVEHAARVQRREAPDIARIIAEGLPSGATTTAMVEGELPDPPTVVTTADPDDPLVAPMFERLDDGPALAADQVLMSDSALRQFGGTVGDTVTVPGVGRAEVVGRVRDAGDWTRRVIVVARDRNDMVVPDLQHVWLIGGLSRAERRAVAEDLSQKLADHGGWQDESVEEMVPRAGAVIEASDRPPPSGDAIGLARRPGVWGAALLLILIAVVASAAFTVDHRRRMRQAGLLGAVGASPSQVVRIATWEALAVGTAGAVSGVVAGVAAVVVGHPAIERFLQRSITGVDLDWLDLVVPAVLGVAAALLAARRPARSAARVPIVIALRGRSAAPLSRETLRSTVVVAAPVVLVVLVIGGWLPLVSRTSLFGIVGAASLAAGPLMVLLARRVGRWRVLARLAVRSVARHRERTAVAVGALTALVGVVTSDLLVIYALQGVDARRMQVLFWLLVGVSACALVLVGSTSVMGAIETDGEVRTAVAVGAPPAFRRWLQGAQAGIQVTLAMLLGVSGGLLVALVQPGMAERLLVWAPLPELVLLVLVPGPLVGAVIAVLSRSARAQPIGRRIT